MIAKSDRIAQLQNILVATEGRSSEAVQVLQAESEAVREQHEAERKETEREMKVRMLELPIYCLTCSLAIFCTSDRMPGTAR